MSKAAPLVDRILAAAETVLRRHGVEKTNVVDIARALGISHANIYRHFPSKKALLDAVAARWLERVTAPLAGHRGGPDPPGHGTAGCLVQHPARGQAAQGARRP